MRAKLLQLLYLMSKAEPVDRTKATATATAANVTTYFRTNGKWQRREHKRKEVMGGQVLVTKTAKPSARVNV